MEEQIRAARKKAQDFHESLLRERKTHTMLASFDNISIDKELDLTRQLDEKAIAFEALERELYSTVDALHNAGHFYPQQQTNYKPRSDSINDTMLRRIQGQLKASKEELGLLRKYRLDAEGKLQFRLEQVMTYEEEREKMKRLINELTSSVATLEGQLEDEKNVYHTLQGENDLLCSTHKKLTVSYDTLQTAHIALQNSYEALSSKHLHDAQARIPVHNSHSPSPSPTHPFPLPSPPVSSNVHSVDQYTHKLSPTLHHPCVDSILQVAYSNKSKVKPEKLLHFPQALHSEETDESTRLVDELFKEDIQNHNFNDETDSPGASDGQMEGDREVQAPKVLIVATTKKKSTVIPESKKKKLSATVSKSKSLPVTPIAVVRTPSAGNKNIKSKAVNLSAASSSINRDKQASLRSRSKTKLTVKT